MAVFHHPIKAFLHPNPMKNAKGKFLARTTKRNTYNIREVCESLHSKSGIVHVDTMEYHVKLFLAEMADLVEDSTSDFKTHLLNWKKNIYKYINR